MVELMAGTELSARSNEAGGAGAAVLAPDGPVVLARGAGFRICRDPESRAVARTFASEPTGDAATVAQLLAGAMAAAMPPRACRDEIKGPWSGSLEDYVYQLCRAYQTTHVTPRVMRLARDAFRSLGDRRSADFAEQKADEESGHDLLALRDLQDMGLPAEALVAEIVPPNSRRIVALFEDLGQEQQPYGVFGYTFALERYSLWTTSEHILRLQSMAPSGINITRCIRTHSSIGADVDHVADLIAYTADLPQRPQQQVLRATYATARIMFEDPSAQQDEHLMRANLSALLQRWNWTPFEGTAVAVA